LGRDVPLEKIPARHAEEEEDTAECVDAAAAIGTPSVCEFFRITEECNSE
jgi:hypothetical protein